MDRAVVDMLDPGGAADSGTRCIVHVVSVQCLHDLIIIIIIVVLINQLSIVFYM